MDIETIKQLQAKRAGIALQLRPVVIRNTFTEWHLVAHFEVLDTLGKKPIPATVLILTHRKRAAIVNKCQIMGVTFIELPQPISADTGREITVRRSGGRCQRPCVICKKDSFDSADGCLNPEVYSVAVGEWVCNLERPQ